MSGWRGGVTGAGGGGRRSPGSFSVPHELVGRPYEPLGEVPVAVVAAAGRCAFGDGDDDGVLPMLLPLPPPPVA